MSERDMAGIYWPNWSKSAWHQEGVGRFDKVYLDYNIWFDGRAEENVFGLLVVRNVTVQSSIRGHEAVPYSTYINTVRVRYAEIKGTPLTSGAFSDTEICDLKWVRSFYAFFPKILFNL